MFGRKGLSPGSPTAALRILARASSAQSDAPAYALAGDVVDFVNHALRTCHFERGELPPEALWAYHVDYYVAQVNNGGHGQFAHNSHWQEIVLDDIRRGLRAIGAQEAEQAFDSFLTFAASEPQRFAGVVERSGFGQEDVFVERLDSRFYAGLGKQITAALRSWLAGLPVLQLLADPDYVEAMRALAERNPARDERGAARAQAAQEQREADPVYQACNLVCRLTPGDIRFESWLSGRPMQGEGGGSMLTVATSAGPGSIYLLPERAALVMNGESEPRSKISMTIINGFLARERLALPAEILGGAR